MEIAGKQPLLLRSPSAFLNLPKPKSGKPMRAEVTVSSLFLKVPQVGNVPALGWAMGAMCGSPQALLWGASPNPQLQTQRPQTVPDQESGQRHSISVSSLKYPHPSLLLPSRKSPRRLVAHLGDERRRFKEAQNSTGLQKFSPPQPSYLCFMKWQLQASQIYFRGERSPGFCRLGWG